jgi:hypothetical protein
MAPSEYVTMLVSSTGMKSLAGKKLRRLKDKDPLYATLEQSGEHEACKRLMVAELHTLQKSEFLQEAGVSDKFETLTYKKGDDIDVYHNDWDDAMLDLKERGLERNSKTLLMDYRRKFGDKDTLGLILSTEKPETLEDLMDALEKHYAVQETLGGGDRQPRIRQGQRRQWEDSREALGSLGKGGGKGKGGKEKPRGPPPPPSNQQQDSKLTVCALFARTGNCRYGDSCKFSHNKRRAEAWLKEQEATKGKAPNKPPPANKAPGAKDACVYFAKTGKCRFGDKCYGSHDKGKCDEWMKKQKALQDGRQRQQQQDPPGEDQGVADPKAGAAAGLFKSKTRGPRRLIEGGSSDDEGPPPLVDDDSDDEGPPPLVDGDFEPDAGGLGAPQHGVGPNRC